jgi:hypothetical protein
MSVSHVPSLEPNRAELRNVYVLELTVWLLTVGRKEKGGGGEWIPF